MKNDVSEAVDTPTGRSARIFNMTAPGPILPWSWASERLEAASLYWVTTASASGFPHARPVWGAWRKDSFWFSSQNRSIRHIAQNNQASVHIAQGDFAVVVEGIAERVTDDDGIGVLVDAYAEKYSWETRPESGNIKRPEGTTAAVFRITPVNVYGWPLEPLDGWEHITHWAFPGVA
jgi:hypothetical protein